MKFTIQYVPLSKIKPDVAAKMTDPVRRIRQLMWDCMHVLAVRRDRKDGSYTLISGIDRYEYLHKHTKRTHAPCIIDEGEQLSAIQLLLRPLTRQRPKDKRLQMKLARLTPVQWSMIRAFLRQEPRFAELSRIDKLKVLLLALRYKRTVIFCMRSSVEQLHSKEQGKLPGNR